jgi:hypothetical protein
MKRAGNLLVVRDELHGFISNHRAGAAAGLMGLAKITGTDRYAERAWELMRGVYAKQSAEGWFLEYEGPDPGYQTLDTHYQSIFYNETGDRGVLNAVEKSLEFLSYFMHPDGSIGGEYGSRSCPHYFPGGFEVLSPKLPVAEALARVGVKGLAGGHSSGLADADVRNSVPLATSYVLAHEAMGEVGETKVAELPFERTFERVWPEAGIYVRSSEKAYVIYGASKGGVVKIFDKRTGDLRFSSCGYTGILLGSVYVTTHRWNYASTLQVQGLEGGGESRLLQYRIVSSLNRFMDYRRDRRMTPWKLLLFRLFNLSLGRIWFVNDFVRRHFIIGRYLTAKKEMPINSTRSLVFDADTCRIDDEITLEKGARIFELKEHGFLSSVYMASAKYFRTQDLNHGWNSEDLLADLGSSGRAKISHVIA